MGVYTIKVAFKWQRALTTVMLVLACVSVFAQKIDSPRVSFKSKSKTFHSIPQIKANVPTYRPNIYNYYPSVSVNSATAKTKDKSGKTFTILKIYPNPVVEQLNISLHLEKEANLSIKITDLLGNEIVTLANERAPSGEQTKTFNMPAKLSSGIYFLRIVAGGEPIIKRISVL